MNRNLRFRYLSAVCLFLVLLTSFNSGGQTLSDQSFIGFPESGFSELHESALNQADLEAYRLRNSERIFEFESGARFKLLSAIQLVELGAFIDPANYNSKSDLNPNVTWIFKLIDSNQLAIRSKLAPESKLSQLKADPEGRRKTRISAYDLEHMSKEKREHVLSDPSSFEIK